MENWFSIRKGTDIAEDVFQNLTGPVGILPHPAGGVGIGADGDDFAAQFLETAEVGCIGQKVTAAVHAAGVHLQALPLLGKLMQNFIQQLPVFFIRHRTGCRMAAAFADVGQMSQNIEIRMVPDTFQGSLQMKNIKI